MGKLKQLVLSGVKYVLDASGNLFTMKGNMNPLKVCTIMRVSSFFFFSGLVVLPVFLLGDGAWISLTRRVRTLLAVLMYTTFVVFCLFDFINHVRKRCRDVSKTLYLIKRFPYYFLLMFLWFLYIVVMCIITVSFWGVPKDIH